MKLRISHSPSRLGLAKRSFSSERGSLPNCRSNSLLRVVSSQRVPSLPRLGFFILAHFMRKTAAHFSRNAGRRTVAVDSSNLWCSGPCNLARAWPAVAIKSQRLLHGAGGGGEAGTAAGGGVFVTMILSAHASAVHVAPAISRSSPRKHQNFFHVVPRHSRMIRSTGHAVPPYFPKSASGILV